MYLKIAFSAHKKYGTSSIRSQFYLFNINKKKHLWTYQTVCKALLKGRYMIGYLRCSLKGFRAEGDIDTIYFSNSFWNIHDQTCCPWCP